MYTMLLIHISFVLCLNSPVSLTKQYKSSSNSLGNPQVYKTKKPMQVSQWAIFAALILLAWMVVLYKNLEIKVSAILFFVFTVVAFVYLLLQLICIMLQYPTSPPFMVVLVVPLFSMCFFQDIFPHLNYICSTPDTTRLAPTAPATLMPCPVY